MRLFATIRPENQSSDIRWLVIEEDIYGSGGVFLFGHKSLSEGSEFDSWHKNVADAKVQAQFQWGVLESDWKSED